MKAPRKISESEAVAMIPESAKIHVFVQEGEELLSQEWSRASVLARIRSQGVELSGDRARSANHGLVSVGVSDSVFIETIKEKKDGLQTRGEEPNPQGNQNQEESRS